MAKEGNGSAKPEMGAPDPEETDVQGGVDGAGTEDGEEPEDDETWFSQLDPTIRQRAQRFFDGKTTGLKSALDSERANAKKLEKQLRAAADKAEKGSELEKQLKEAADNLEAERDRATFYEEAQAESVLPGYARVLWKAAQDDEYRTKNGAVDWKALRADFGAMFAQAKPAKGGAGAGVGGNGGGAANVKSSDMNSLFRAQVAAKNK